MTEPYYQDEWCTIWHGDCREVLPGLDVEADLVLTDPPYGVGIAEWDNDIPPQEILTLCLKKSCGPCLWFGAAPPRCLFSFGRYAPMPDRCIVWHATFSLARTAAHGMFYRWHPIWLWANGGKYKLERDVIECPCDGRNGWNHPGTKPLRLISTLVMASDSLGTILDPFMGSGTTLRVAKDLGRYSIGIELEERYCEIAANRLRQEALPLDYGRRNGAVQQALF